MGILSFLERGHIALRGKVAQFEEELNVKIEAEKKVF